MGASHGVGTNQERNMTSRWKKWRQFLSDEKGTDTDFRFRSGHEMSDAIPSLDALKDAVSLACQPSYVPKITRGRAEVLAMPRAWVLAHIEQVAYENLNLTDEWEYRRLLELFQQLDIGLVQRLVVHGQKSPDADIREAAEDFRT
jgi:hypothetical protein